MNRQQDMRQVSNRCWLRLTAPGAIVPVIRGHFCWLAKKYGVQMACGIDDQSMSG